MGAELQGPCFQATEEHIWSKASRLCLKRVPCGQIEVHHFNQSLIDDCYCEDTIFMLYVDDGIFIGSDDAQLQAAIKELWELNLKIEGQGHPVDYVGVNTGKLRNRSYEFTQRAFIDSIIKHVGVTDSKSMPVPAKVSLQLHAFKEDPPFDQHFDYHSAIGKLNYLAQTTRPDIMYATHQVVKP